MIGGRLCAAMLAAGLTLPAAQAEPASPPGFTNSRYGEDWGYLRDPAARTGEAWERLKFVPLDAAGVYYLSLGADLRLRYEAYRGNLWGDPPKPDEGYGWSRISYAVFEPGRLIAETGPAKIVHFIGAEGQLRF